jgi:hypothetical protein
VRAIVRANLPDYQRAAGEDDQQAKLQVFAQRQHQLAGDPRSRPMSSCVRIKQLAASGSASEWRCSPTISDNDAPSARTATMDPILVPVTCRDVASAPRPTSTPRATRTARRTFRQAAEAPWRLALATVLQFAGGLSDRQAADSVRGRIDWKYLLGLELADPGFDHRAQRVLHAFGTCPCRADRLDHDRRI